MKHFGYYGKIRHRGDFVRYNLPQSFINVWDDWLQLLIVQGEEHHKQEWSSIYEDSDIYRFALSSGIAGDEVWVGLMIPGTDKVGRRFPFCLAAALPDGHSPISAQVSFHNWYLAVEALALEFPNEQFDFDSLQDRMVKLTQDHRPSTPRSLSEAFAIGKSDSDGPVPIHATSSGILGSLKGQTQMLHAQLTQVFFQYSVWTTSQSSRKNSNTLVTGGLPVSTCGLALFNQNWADCDCGNLVYSEDADTIYDASQPTGKAMVVDSADLSPAMAVVTDNNNTMDEKLSTGDWSALETVEEGPQESGSTPETEPIPSPSVEPLELEEDSTSTAPWET